MNIPTIYEDSDLIVINKLAGIIVHPVKDEKNTLIDLIKENYPNAKLVHRLDKDTSGLLIIAKNEKAYNWLKGQFSNREIKKTYLALVHGKLKEKTGIIAKSISKSSKKRRQTIAPIGNTKQAITRYKVIEEFDNFSLLEASPETGRTHQIRVHLASIGNPIAGDETYKFKRQKTIKDLKRQFLHAHLLKFKLLNGNIIELKSELPKELKLIIKNFKDKKTHDNKIR